MQKINPLLDEAGKALKRVSKGSQTGAGQSKHSSAQPQGDSHADQPDRIDAINQLFAEFELAYHNQYYKAYSTEERLILAKKYWLGCLSEFSPRQIVAAGHKLVRSQDFLPTISAVIRGCEEGIALFGLPAPRDAYMEACRAPAPKAAYPWSHVAVYLAGRAADWYFLATETEEKSFPVYAHYYRDFCQRVIHGEELEKPAVAALVNNPGRPLSNEEQQRRMALLREQLDL